MSIKQLNGTYVAGEDRVLLRVSTDSGEEFRFWLTRPVTGLLLAAIRADAAHTIARKFSPQVAQSVAEFEQQAVKAETKFDRQFLPGATLPLGEAPALVIKLVALEKADGVALGMTLQNGKHVDLRLPRRLAQQFGILLDKLQKNANWGLDESAPVAPAAGEASAPGAAPAKKLVH